MRALPSVDTFLAPQRLAIVGISRDPKAFSRDILRAFDEAGYETHLVNPEAAKAGEAIQGRKVFAGLRDIEPPVESVLVITPDDQIMPVVEEAVECNVKNLWLWGPGSGEKSANRDAVR